MEIQALKRQDELTRLAVRMRKGDRKAAAALYDDLMPKAFGFFFARTGHRESAEDLSQDIFLKLAEKIGVFDETRGSFTVWFWQVARNMVIDHYREKKEAPFSSMEDEAVEALASEEMPDLDRKIEYGKLLDFMKGLDEEDRELFELRYAAELPYREISEILQRSEGALRIAAHRLKEKVRIGFRENRDNKEKKES